MHITKEGEEGEERRDKIKNILRKLRIFKKNDLFRKEKKIYVFS